MFTATGRLPVKRAGGRYRNPESVRPSKLFQRTSSGSGKVAVFRPPVSLYVQRSTVPVVTLYEYTSAGVRTDSKVTPSSVLLACHWSPPMTPTGKFGTGRSCPVAVASTCNTLMPSSLVTKANHFPSRDRSKSSTPQAMWPVRAVCFFVARSRYASR